MPSPTCQVKEGAGAYTSTTGGFNATAAAALTIKLVDTSANTWSISCVSTDELSDAATVNASLVIDNVAKTATLTAPAAGRTYRFKSVVNGGYNAKGKRQQSYETTFCIYVLTGGGYRVIAADETIEGDATFGWVKRLNELIRNPTGMPDATAGTKGSVQLTNDLGGSAASPTVVGLTGTVGVLANDATDIDSLANAQGDVYSRLRSLQTAAAATATLYAFTMADETVVTVDFVVTMARRTNVTKAARYKGSVTYRRTGGGAPTIVGAAEYATPQETTAGDDVAFDVSSNDIRVRATSADADARNWFGEIRVQVTVAT